jgi:hypothetical protein
MESKLIPDKANLGFRFPYYDTGHGGTYQSSSWDHIFLGLFWMVRPINNVKFAPASLEGYSTFDHINISFKINSVINQF